MPQRAVAPDRGHRRSGAFRTAGVLTGGAGGLVAAASVTLGFLQIAGDREYQPRTWLGLLALALSLAAGLIGIWRKPHPTVSGLGMVLLGITGFTCSLLWYINTFYLLALPLWIVGATLLAISALAEPEG